MLLSLRRVRQSSGHTIPNSGVGPRDDPDSSQGGSWGIASSWASPPTSPPTAPSAGTCVSSSPPGRRNGQGNRDNGMPPRSDTRPACRAQPPCADTRPACRAQPPCSDTRPACQAHPPCTDTRPACPAQPPCSDTRPACRVQPPCSDTRPACRTSPCSTPGLASPSFQHSTECENVPQAYCAEAGRGQKAGSSSRSPCPHSLVPPLLRWAGEGTGEQEQWNATT